MSRTNVQCGNQCETSQTSHDHDNSWHILTHFDVGSSAVESSELELWELWALSCWSCSAKSSGTASSEVPGTPSTFDVKNPGRSMEIVVMSKIPPRQVTPFHIYVYIYIYNIINIKTCWSYYLEGSASNPNPPSQLSSWHLTTHWLSCVHHCSTFTIVAIV